MSKPLFWGAMKNGYRDLKGRFLTLSADVQVLNMVSDLQKAERIQDVDVETSPNHVLRALILLEYMADGAK